MSIADDPQPPRRPGYAGLVKSALTETTRIVRDMHGAIAGQAFGALEQVPLVKAPARLVASAHDAISRGVYSAIDGIGAGLLDVVDAVEQRVAGNAHALLPVGIKSALNAAFGDHLDAENSAFAIPMELLHAGTALPLDARSPVPSSEARLALRKRFGQTTSRIAVFVHGLGCSDRSWEAGGTAEVNLGLALEQLLGYTPLYLRYNSGLPIAENGAALAGLLDVLVRTWRKRKPEFALIGHSMGGLVARSACEQAPADSNWAQCTRMLIALGSPNTGAPLARHGQLLQRTLDNFAVTAPLGRLGAARSRGVKDLHDGLPAGAICGHPQIQLRFVGAHLGASADGALANLFGDGLVPVASATTLDGHTPTTHIVLNEVGHLGLLNDPRVLEQIKAWLLS